MDNKENFNKIIVYLEKEKKGCLLRLSEPQNYLYAKDSSFEVETKNNVIEICSIQDISKFEIIIGFARLKSLTDIVSSAETMLFKRQFVYFRIDGNGNAVASHNEKVNYIHKIHESVKIAETLKIYRLAKDLLFEGTQTTLL